jgi:hypothetical protein
MRAGHDSHPPNAEKGVEEDLRKEGILLTLPDENGQSSWALLLAVR